MPLSPAALSWLAGGGAAAALVAAWWLWRQRQKQQQRASSSLAAHDAMAAAARLRPLMVPITRAVNRVYSHGGWMGAAPELVASPQWLALVGELTPAAHERVALAAAAGRASPGALMRIFENSPVLVAFGVAHELRERRHAAAAAGAPAAAVALATGGSASHACATGGSASHAPVVVEWDVYTSREACNAADAAVRAAGGLDAVPPAERAALAHRLAATTAISHGSLWHIALERLLGLPMHASILQRSGGMTTHTWLRAYFHALATAAPDVDVRAPAVATAATASATPHLSVFLDVKSSLASPAALALLTEGLNAAGVHVWGVGSFVHGQLTELAARHVRAGAEQVVTVPDAVPATSSPSGAASAGGPGADDTPAARRRRVSPREVDRLIGHEPLGSAPQPSQQHQQHHHQRLRNEVAPEVAAEGELPQAAAAATPGGLPLTSARLPPPIAFYIFSFVGEIQAAAAAGRLPRGAHVLFNGGTMISHHVAGADADATQATYAVRPALLRELGALVDRLDLHLGYYTQEALLDAPAADLLARTANEHPALFEHGFAYSGLPGRATGDIRPSPTSAAVGWAVPWWLRGLIGRRWRLADGTLV